MYVCIETERDEEIEEREILRGRETEGGERQGGQRGEGGGAKYCRLKVLAGSDALDITAGQNLVSLLAGVSTPTVITIFTDDPSGRH